jgi:hypothetical protein
MRYARQRQRIAELQASLMKAQAELGEVNRCIRTQKSSSQLAHSRERARQQLEQRHNDFFGDVLPDQQGQS